MDDFSIQDESFQPLIRAVQLSTRAAFPPADVPSDACQQGSLLAVCNPYQVALAARANALHVVPLAGDAELAPAVTLTLPHPIAQVAHSPACPHLFFVLLNNLPASQALRAYDLGSLVHQSKLVQFPSLPFPEDVGAACKFVHLLVTPQANQPARLALVLDNGTAFVCGLDEHGFKDSAVFEVHSTHSSRFGAATAIAVQRSGKKGSNVVAVGTDRGNVLVYSDSGNTEGTFTCVGNIPVLVSGWLPRYLHHLSEGALLVSYQSAALKVRHAVIYLDDEGKPISPDGDSMSHLGELCSADSDDTGGKAPVILSAGFPSWNLSVISSSFSVDVEFLAKGMAESEDEGGQDEKDEKWYNWQFDEGRTVHMPFTESYEETFPVGLAVHLTNKEPVLASSPSEPPLRPMPRLLVLTSAGALLNYVVADDRGGATCEAITDPLPVPEARQPSPIPMRSLQADAPDPHASSGASHFAETPHSRRLTRRRSPSLNSVDDGQVDEGTDGYFNDDDDPANTNDSVSRESHSGVGGDSGSYANCGELPFNPDCGPNTVDSATSDAGQQSVSREVQPFPSSTGSQSSRDCVEAPSASAGMVSDGLGGKNTGFWHGSRGLEQSHHHPSRESSTQPIGQATNARDSGFNPEAYQSEMRRIMAPDLSAATRNAAEPDPLSLLKSMIIEMEEELAVISRVNRRMQETLSDRNVKIVEEMDSVYGRLRELRSNIVEQVRSHETMHGKGVQHMRKAMSIGREVEEVLLLFNSSPLKQEGRDRGLPVEAVRIDEKLDSKEREVSRALQSIEEKLEHCVARHGRRGGPTFSSATTGVSSGLMPSGGRKVSPWLHHRFRKNEEGNLGQQIFSSLSLQGARIKRVLSLLSAMESQLHDHRRVLRGRRGADIGLSQARLEKLSISCAQDDRSHVTASETRSGVSVLQKRIAMSGKSRLSAGGKDSLLGPEAQPSQILPETYRALRDIAMQGGRDRITVHPVNAESSLLTGRELRSEREVFNESARAGSQVDDDSQGLVKVVPQLASHDGGLRSGHRADDSLPEGHPARMSSPLGMLPSSSRRGSGGLFTSTKHVRAGGHAVVADKEPVGFGADSATVSRSGRSTATTAQIHSSHSVSSFAVQNSRTRPGSKPPRISNDARDSNVLGHGTSNQSFTGAGFSTVASASREFGTAVAGSSTGDSLAVVSAASGGEMHATSETNGSLMAKKNPASFFAELPQNWRDNAPTTTAFLRAGSEKQGPPAAFPPAADSETEVPRTAAFPLEDSKKDVSTLPALGAARPSNDDDQRSLASAALPLTGPHKEVSPDATQSRVFFEQEGTSVTSLPPAGSEKIGSGKMRSSIASLPPEGSEKETPAIAILPPVGSEKEKPSVASVPPAGSKKEAPSIPPLPPAGSGKVSTSIANLPPPGSEKEAPSIPALPPTGSEKVSTSIASLPSPGLEKEAPSIAALAPAVSEKEPLPIAGIGGSEKAIPSIATLPTASSENETPSIASLPPSGSEKEAPSIASLPPAGSEKESPSFTTLPFATETRHVSQKSTVEGVDQVATTATLFPSGSPTSKVDAFRPVAVPSSDSEEDEGTGARQLPVIESSRSEKESVVASESRSLGKSYQNQQATDFGFGAKAAGSSAPGLSFGQSLASPSQPAPDSEESRLSSSGGLSFGSLGLGNGSSKPAVGNTSGTGLFGSTSLATSTNAKLAFGDPQSSPNLFDSTKLNPSPFGQAASPANPSFTSHSEASPFGSGFGGSPAGNTPQSTNAFGSFPAGVPAASFGSTSNLGTGSFDSSPQSGGLGSSMPNSAFGAPSVLGGGSGAVPTGSASFGRSSTVGFGAQAPPAFGTSANPSGAFGQVPSAGFGSPSVLGASGGQTASTSSGFGSAAPTFGGSQGAVSGFASFGAQSGPGGFGSSNSQGSPFGAIAQGNVGHQNPSIGHPQQGSSGFGSFGSPAGAAGSQSNGAFSSSSFTQRRA